MEFIKLRDYQIDIYDKIKNEFKKGKIGVGACLGCRSGKSYIMAKIAQDANKKGNRVLILAHRNSLIAQHKKLFEELEVNNMTRIASVFTEVNHLGENGKIDLIIIDEAHISGCNSYRKVCEYYKCRRILFTATFSRLDGKPLDLADVIVNGITTEELIKRGAISSYKYYAPKLDVDFSDLKMSGYDYNNEQLYDKMSKNKIYGDVLKYYRELADGKQAIAYCINVKHSIDTATMFNENGIPAMHMDSSTPENKRLEILKDFKDGKFKILCNCNLISEGITLETADVALLLRKTASVSLYIQQACRCLTPVDGKEATIIDFVGNVFYHGMPTATRDWSLNSKVKEYYNENKDGTFKIRVCKKCFSVFETADKCPFCGAEYKLDQIEIENIKYIELKKIDQANIERQQKSLNLISEKVKSYNSFNQCNNFLELTQFAKAKGYKPGFAFVVAKNMGYRVPRKKVKK